MDQFGHYYQNYENTKATYNKVYINRNFNRIGVGVSTLSSNNLMYFNPNFSHAVSSQYNIEQNTEALRPKIHVNPNFIRLKSQDSFSVNSSQTNAGPSMSKPTNITCPQSVCTQQMQAVYEQCKNLQMGTISKSRYCLVREKDNKMAKTPLLERLPNNNSQQTVKVNKYKSVSLITMKQNLATSKSSRSKINEGTLIQSEKSKSKCRTSLKPLSSNTQNTRFKYIKRNSIAKLLPDTKQVTVRRISITHNKSILKSNSRQTKTIIKGALKKNNIPCPLFKKYGKCLRMIQGCCDYLHDKNHVSICRRFLTGICHDKQCSLSHDLTDKKMPTCYFYLQGICTKEDCPYLHVKLNEKTKICSDFLKGYCEKGDKCLYRHVSPNNAKKLTKVKQQSSFTHINKRNHNESTKIFRKNIVKKKDNTIPKVTTENQSGKEAAKDQRYFRDIADDVTSVEQCDLIKPIRCKLGTLPSYIQL